MPTLAKQAEYGVRWWCPGCRSNHVVPVKQLGAPEGTNRPGAADGWDWNESWESPTLSPSILVNGTRGTATEEWNRAHPRCHSFVRDGSIEFLGDCEHDLAGQTVPMVPLDEV